MAVAACGGGGGGGGDSGGGGSGTPILSLSASTLDFGKVVVGQTTTRPLSITNTGTAPLTGIAISNPGAPFAVDGSCGDLAANASCHVTVTFSPTDQDGFDGTIQITSNAPAANVALSGIGQGLNVEITSVENMCTDETLRIRVFVSGADNFPITGLNANQFTVLVGDEEIDDFDFETITDPQAVSVALAIDWSNSLSDFRTTVIDTADVFIHSLNDTDTAALYRFSGAIDTNAVDFVPTDADGKAELVDVLRGDYGGAIGGSAIWDTAEFAIGQAANETNPLKALVLVTDGRDNRSTATADTVIELGQASNVNVFTLGYGDRIQTDELESVAQGTGGAAFVSPTGEQFAEFFENITSLLSDQHELVFVNPSPTTPILLRVVVVDDFDMEGDDERSVAACP